MYICVALACVHIHVRVAIARVHNYSIMKCYVSVHIVWTFPCQDLFVCMLRNMFEEYQFFPRFPERELQITGQLFGGIIEHGLVT